MRAVTGYLWRFFWFRWVTVWLITEGPAAWGPWLMLETPCGIGLRGMWLREGALSEAAQVGRLVDDRDSGDRQIF